MIAYLLLHRDAPVIVRDQVARATVDEVFENLRLELRRGLLVLAAWAAAHPDARWVTGEGWTYAAFPGGLPSRAQLDAVVADRPAWLVSYDGHTGWANSAALRLAGVTRETKDPPGGAIVRDEKGEPTGALKESAMDLVARLVPRLLPHEKERALKNGIAQAAAWGLTGVHQAGIDAEGQAVKVPHVGWNSLAIRRPSVSLAGVADASYVYFTHSYAAPVGADSIAVARHGGDLGAAVERAEDKTAQMQARARQ